MALTPEKIDKIRTTLKDCENYQKTARINNVTVITVKKHCQDIKVKKNPNINEKLEDEFIDEFVAEFDAGGIKLKDLAKKYQINPSTASRYIKLRGKNRPVTARDRIEKLKRYLTEKQIIEYVINGYSKFNGDVEEASKKFHLPKERLEMYWKMFGNEPKEKKTILILDHPNSSKIIGKELKDAGYNIIIVNDSYAACEIIREGVHYTAAVIDSLIEKKRLEEILELSRAFRPESELISIAPGRRRKKGFDKYFNRNLEPTRIVDIINKKDKTPYNHKYPKNK